MAYVVPLQICRPTRAFYIYIFFAILRLVEILLYLFLLDNQHTHLVLKSLKCSRRNVCWPKQLSDVGNIEQIKEIWDSKNQVGNQKFTFNRALISDGFAQLKLHLTSTCKKNNSLTNKVKSLLKNNQSPTSYPNMNNNRLQASEIRLKLLNKLLQPEQQEANNLLHLYILVF